MKIKRLAGSQQLLSKVCGHFKMRGGSLKEWCQANGITDRYARYCLIGRNNGTKALEWRWRMVEASYEDDPYWQVVRELRWLISDLEEQILEKVNQPQLKGIPHKYIPGVRDLSRITNELRRIISD